MVLAYEPTMRRNIEQEPLESENQRALLKAKDLETARREVKAQWEQAQGSMAKYYNKHRKPKSFAPGDLVMLSSKNIRMRKASKKLAGKFLGPFKVLKVIGQNAYTLQLPRKYGRLHHTFHVSLLEAYSMREGRGAPEPIEIDGEEEWEVEKILDLRETKAGRQFLVRWKGYSEADDSWEPAEHLLHAGEKLDAFWKSRNA